MTRKAPAKKTTAARKKPAAKKAPTKKAAAKRPDSRKRSTAKKPTARKAKAPAKRTAKKAPAKKSARRKSTPRKPNVDEVVADLADKSPPGGGGNDEPPPPAPPGAVETACRRELEQLGLHETALGASAIALARMADLAMDSPAAASSALREMRMALATARGLGKPGGQPAGDDGSKEGGEVVPESRLERMRREREQGGRA